jgi:glycosyltransferase involved in cell wall biosynthesis
MSDPLVSVLMPVRNGMPYVVEAARSVFAQTYRNIELIVQDCLSTDGTVESLRELLVPSGMRLEIVSEIDSGIADGFNRALRRSHGEYLANLEADNLYLPNHIETGVKHLLANPHVAGVATSQHMVDAIGSRLFDWMAPELDFFGILCQERVVPSGSTIRNRLVLGDDSSYLVDDRMSHCFDYEYWLRLAIKGLQIDSLPNVTYSTRLSEKSGSCDLSRYPEFCREKIFGLDLVVQTGGQTELARPVKALGRAGIFMWAAELSWGLGGTYKEALHFTAQAMNNYRTYPRIGAFLDGLARETGRNPRADLLAGVDTVPALIRQPQKVGDS